MMLDYLEAEKQERDKSRFAKLLQENIGSSDSPVKLRDSIQRI